MSNDYASALAGNYASGIPTDADRQHDCETIYRAVRDHHGHDIAADVAVSVLSGSTPADALSAALRRRDSAFRAMRRDRATEDAFLPLGEVPDGATIPCDLETGEPLADCVLDRFPAHTQTTAQHLADGLSVEESARRQRFSACAIRHHRRAIRSVLVRSILDGLIGVDR
jgi:hypothetical protein